MQRRVAVGINGIEICTVLDERLELPFVVALHGKVQRRAERWVGFARVGTATSTQQLHEVKVAHIAHCQQDIIRCRHRRFVVG